jgi:hypothetical protein
MFHMSNDSGLFLDSLTPTSLPLYEAKMIHQFDHRWATYRWDATAGEAVTEDATEGQKARPDFTVQPRYWVEERHVLSRLARVPRCVTRAWDAQDSGPLRDALANWLLAAEADDALAGMRIASARQRVIDTGGRLFASLPADEKQWHDDRAVTEARDWPPLSGDEVALLREADDLLSAAHALLDRRSPRWLMGWRDICRATDVRSVISSVMPRVGVGNKIPLFFSNKPAKYVASILGSINSLPFDFFARQKIGGATLNYFIFKQFPVLAPNAYSEIDLGFIVPRVLELTYTAEDLKPWAEDLGYRGRPFTFEPFRRAQLRAELDAYYAKLFGLNRDEIRYILDPSDTHGPEYPTVTFPVLKRSEEAAFGEYRTRRLVLEAWDRLT